MAIGSTNVDQARFPASAGGYESPDYATAANRVDIDVQGGVGSRAGDRRRVGGRVVVPRADAAVHHVQSR